MDQKTIEQETQEDMFMTLFGEPQEAVRKGKRLYGRPAMLSITFVDQKDNVIPMEMFIPFGRYTAKRKEWAAFLQRTAARLSDAEHQFHPMTWEEECKFYDVMMEKAKDRRYQKMIESIPEDKMGQA